MRRLKGLVASLAIIAIAAGLPFVLLTLAGNPLEDLPTLDAFVSMLTAPDDGTLLLLLMQIVAWLGWAFLVVSILVELVAQLRGVRAPRLPGFRLPQSAARGLVGAALLLFTAVPVATSASAATAAPVTGADYVTTTITAPATPLVADAEQDSAPEAEQESTSDKSEHKDEAKFVKHTVVHGDTLWSLAQEHLGDGSRYREIVELNPGKLGDRPDFLTTGWVLKIPTDATAKHDSKDGETKQVIVDKGDTLSGIAAEELGDASRYPEIAKASRDVTQPGGAHLTNPDLILPGWTLNIPGVTVAEPQAEAPAKSEGKTTSEGSGKTSQSTGKADTPAPDTADAPAAETPTTETPAAETPAEEAPAGAGESAGQAAAPVPAAPPATETTPPSQEIIPSAEDDATDEMGEDSLWRVATSAGIGTLLAASVLTVVARRRRTQQRRRRPGQQMPMPTGQTAAFEQDLRAAADSLSIETVDTALRALAQHCTETGQPLPAVRAARLTAQTFELYLEDPADLPAPWTDTAEAKIWTLDVVDVDQLTPIEATTVPAPYPSLVTIGHDDELGHVLLNLEHLGALGITGDDTSSREILAALAIELATSVWADDLRVTLVSAFPELEDTLRTGRIRYVPTADRIIDELARRAAEDRQALAEVGMPDLYAARSARVAPDAWSPEIIMLAGSITGPQYDELADLVGQLPHIALATITNGTSVGEWDLQLVPGQEDARLAPIGLHLRPQRLPFAEYGHLLQLVSLADEEELLDAGPPAVQEPSVAQVEAVSVVDEVADPVSAIPSITLETLAAAADAEEAAEANRGDQAVAPDASSAVEEGSLRASDEEEAGQGEVPAEVDESHTGLHDAQQADTVEETSPADETGEPAQEEGTVTATTAPTILVLGPVDVLNASGPVETSKRARLLEYATYLVLHPGTTHVAIDDAIWPDRRTDDNLNTRNTATVKLRSWFGRAEDGDPYLPRHPRNGYAFREEVTTDHDRWRALLGENPVAASTENLEAALRLVRGIPFEGAFTRRGRSIRYAWAEPIQQRLTAEIVDASYELGRRRLMEGRWRAAEQAVTVGLRVEPQQESLWRLRILAAHESRNPDAEEEAITRLLAAHDEIESDLEPETVQLLAALRNPGADFDRLMATAL